MGQREESMKTAINNITGDKIMTKGITTDAYRDSWDRIFDHKNKNADECVDTPCTNDQCVAPDSQNLSNEGK